MSSARKEEATSPAMSAPRRWPRLLQMSVGLVVIIILACVFLPEAIDRLGPRSGLPSDERHGLLNEGRQDECLSTNVLGHGANVPDPELFTGDPDLTPRPNPGVVRIIRLTNA
jgi:hypothetical protein